MTNDPRRLLAAETSMTDRTPARFQFGIRHLLVVMVVVSALAAVMGPTMRQWSAGKWIWYVAHLTAAAVAYVVTLVQQFRAAEVRRQLAGEIHWQVPLTWDVGSRLPTWGRIAVAALLLGGIVGILELLSFLAIDSVEVGLWSIACGITFGLLAGGGIFDEVAKPSHASIGENGLLIGERFVDWRTLGPPSEPSTKPMQIIWPELQLSCTLLFPAESEAEIRTFVRSRLAGGAAKAPG